MSRAVLIALTAAMAMTVATLRLARVDLSYPSKPASASDPAPSTIPPLRVLLGGKERSSWTVRIDGPYRVTPLADWRVLAQGEKLVSATVTANGAAIKVGANTFPTDRLVLEAIRPGTLWVNGARYRGNLRLLKRPGGLIAAVNAVDVEDYVASVVNGEMPADFPREARLAQAIVARSYALCHAKLLQRASDYDVYDSTRSQVYRGMEYVNASGRRLAVETADSRQIARDTQGVILTYSGKLFCTYYSAVCGGHTLRGRAVFSTAAPPLAGVPCTYCQDAPRCHWKVKLPRPEIETRAVEYLASHGRQLGALKDIHMNPAAPTELPQVRLVCERGEHVVSAQEFRQIAGSQQLHSPLCTTLKLDDAWLHLEGRGWGHSVGMCQWGARGQALHGRTCTEILAHYFPGSELAVVK